MELDLHRVSRTRNVSNKWRGSLSKLIEKKLNTEIAFAGNFLKVYRDQVESPNGKKYYREYIKHPGAAMIVPVLSNGNLILIQQYRHAVGMICWEFPAGKKDLNENTEVTAKRELKEEIGGESPKWTFLQKIHPVIGYSDEFIDIFLAENVQLGESQLDDGEFVVIFEKNLDEVQKMIQQGEITDVKTICGFYAYRDYRASLSNCSA